MEKSGALKTKMLVLSWSMICFCVLIVIGGVVCFVQRYVPDPYDPLNDDDTYLTYVGLVLLVSGLMILPTWVMILCGVMQENPSLIPSGWCLCCFVGLLCQGTVLEYRASLMEDLQQHIQV